MPPIDPGLVAVALIFGLPVIAVLTNHQQKMAAIIHGQNRANNNGAQAEEMQALRREVGELKQLVHQQTIICDNLTQMVAKGQLSGSTSTAPSPLERAADPSVAGTGPDRFANI